MRGNQLAGFLLALLLITAAVNGRDESQPACWFPTRSSYCCYYICLFSERVGMSIKQGLLYRCGKEGRKNTCQGESRLILSMYRINLAVFSFFPRDRSYVTRQDERREG